MNRFVCVAEANRERRAPLKSMPPMFLTMPPRQAIPKNAFAGQ